MGSPLRKEPAPVPDRSGPQPIRVLIVDDSAVARAVLGRMLDEHDDIEVVAQAPGAAAALAVLERAEVDIILLDLQMPGVGGLDALPELIAHSRARVLVVSTACAEGASSIIAALSLGAADTLLKPSTTTQLAGSFAAELTDKLRRIARSPASESSRRERSAALSPAPAIERKRMECVGIGASTGGVHALATFFEALPRDFAVPILITQHLPAPFMPYFADQLQEMTGRPTRMGAAGLQPMPGELLLAPGDAHLTLARTRNHVHVRLERSRSVTGCLPSVDPMLASLGRVYGEAAVGVVLSGMGRDGAAGAQALVKAGGSVLVQDAPTSVVWGMPGAVAERGVAQAVLPPDEIARRIAQWNEGAPHQWN